jgi:hypothetical protein
VKKKCESLGFKAKSITLKLLKNSPTKLAGSQRKFWSVVKRNEEELEFFSNFGDHREDR